MKIKDNTVRIDFSPQLLIGLYQLELISRIEADKELVITSGSESTTKHSVRSLHYSGNAVDIRSRHYTKVDIDRIIAQFKRDMTCDFDIVVESDHIHLEYQPKGR